MKFDIIDALKIAEKKIGHPCTMQATQHDDSYLVQIKVVVDDNVYGQQFAFTDVEVMMDQWEIMNEKFQGALAALKLQIEDV